MPARIQNSGFADIIATLSEMDETTRQRTLAAALAYFGEGLPLSSSTVNQLPAADGSSPALPAKAVTWMKQTNVSMEEIEKVFHIGSGGVEIIAATIPGKSKKDQTFNAYNLVGAAKILASGASNFEDKEARELCISQGCYDAANHATNFRNKSNDLVGSKDKGWALTAPGMKSAAALVKEIAANS